MTSACRSTEPLLETCISVAAWPASALPVPTRITACGVRKVCSPATTYAASAPGWLCTGVMRPEGPAGPSVKSQILPPDWATRPIGPAAACAWVSVAKLSTRQNSGPAGNSATFFSASGLMTSVPEPATPTPPGYANADAVHGPTRTRTATTTMKCGFIGRSSFAKPPRHLLSAPRTEESRTERLRDEVQRFGQRPHDWHLE